MVFIIMRAAIADSGDPSRLPDAGYFILGFGHLSASDLDHVEKLKMLEHTKTLILLCLLHCIVCVTPYTVYYVPYYDVYEYVYEDNETTLMTTTESSMKVTTEEPCEIIWCRLRRIALYAAQQLLSP